MEQLLTWLDQTFLATILQGEENTPDVTIHNFSITPAVKAGNNYMSCVYRVKLEFRVGEKNMFDSWIIKAPLTKGFHSENAQKINFYEKEPKIYNELIPKMNAKIKCEFSPKSLSCPIKNVLVLKDMKEEGYIMCDKYKQLDYSQCKSVVVTLAKFHAASVAYYHDNPELLKKVARNLNFTEGNSLVTKFLEFTPDCIKITADILNNMDGCKSLADLLLSKAENIADSVLKVRIAKTNGLNVLNHGDLWVNNILFKLNSTNEVVDVKFIDYQFTQFASPALDLVSFIWTSANDNVCEKKQDDLYKIYLKTLNKALEEMGCEERMTVEELYEDLKLATDFAIMIVCEFIPLVVWESLSTANDDPEYSELLKMHYKNNHHRELLQNKMKQILAWISSQ